MKFTAITEEQAYDRLDKPFNPPWLRTPLFFSEWHRVRDRLKDELDRFGTWDAYEEGDYYLGDNAGYSRGIGVALTSEKVLQPTLIPALTRFLKSQRRDYEICLTVSQDRDYLIFVGKDQVDAWCPEETLRLLGIP